MQSVIRIWLLSGVALACFIGFFRLQNLPTPYFDDVAVPSSSLDDNDHFNISAVINGNPFQISIPKTFSQQYENYLVAKSKTFCRENAETLQLMPGTQEESSKDVKDDLLDSTLYIQCVDLLNSHLIKEVLANFPLKIAEPVEEPKTAISYFKVSPTPEQLSSSLMMTIKIPINNGKVYNARFDARTSSPYEVSKALCGQNKEELGLGDDAERSRSCMQNVGNYIVDKLKEYDPSVLDPKEASALPDTVEPVEAEVDTDGSIPVSEHTGAGASVEGATPVEEE